MSKALAIEHLTLDGGQAPGRPDEDPRDGFEHGGWAQPANDPTMQNAMGQRMGASWSLLLGRRTYEQFAAFWPNQPEPNPFTEALNDVQKYVASTTLGGLTLPDASRGDLRVGSPAGRRGRNQKVRTTHAATLSVIIPAVLCLPSESGPPLFARPGSLE